MSLWMFSKILTQETLFDKLEQQKLVDWRFLWRFAATSARAGDTEDLRFFGFQFRSFPEIRQATFEGIGPLCFSTKSNVVTF